MTCPVGLLDQSKPLPKSVSNRRDFFSSPRWNLFWSRRVVYLYLSPQKHVMLVSGKNIEVTLLELLEQWMMITVIHHSYKSQWRDDWGCLLWIDKTWAKDRTYIWVSVWWKTKTPHMNNEVEGSRFERLGEQNVWYIKTVLGAGRVSDVQKRLQGENKRTAPVVVVFKKEKDEFYKPHVGTRVGERGSLSHKEQ